MEKSPFRELAEQFVVGPNSNFFLRKQIKVLIKKGGVNLQIGGVENVGFIHALIVVSQQTGV